MSHGSSQKGLWSPPWIPDRNSSINVLINRLTGLYFETFHIIFRAEQLKSITNQLKLRGGYENQHVILTANFMSVAMWKHMDSAMLWQSTVCTSAACLALLTQVWDTPLTEHLPLIPVLPNWWDSWSTTCELVVRPRSQLPLSPWLCPECPTPLSYSYPRKWQLIPEMVVTLVPNMVAYSMEGTRIILLNLLEAKSRITLLVITTSSTASLNTGIRAASVLSMAIAFMLPRIVIVLVASAASWVVTLPSPAGF